MAAVLSMRDVMARLGVSRKTVLQLRGELRGYQVGRQWRFDQADVDVFISQQKAAAVLAPRPPVTSAPARRRPLSTAALWKGADRYTK